MPTDSWLFSFGLNGEGTTLKPVELRLNPGQAPVDTLAHAVTTLTLFPSLQSGADAITVDAATERTAPVAGASVFVQFTRYLLRTFLPSTELGPDKIMAKRRS